MGLVRMEESARLNPATYEYHDFPLSALSSLALQLEKSSIRFEGVGGNKTKQGKNSIILVASQFLQIFQGVKERQRKR